MILFVFSCTTRHKTLVLRSLALYRVQGQSVTILAATQKAEKVPVGAQLETPAIDRDDLVEIFCAYKHQENTIMVGLACVRKERPET